MSASSMNNPETCSYTLSDATRARFDREVAKYPPTSASPL